MYINAKLQGFPSTLSQNKFTWNDPACEIDIKLTLFPI